MGNSDMKEEEALEYKDDPHYIPEVTSKITTKRKLRSSEQKITVQYLKLRKKMLLVQVL